MLDSMFAPGAPRATFIVHCAHRSTRTSFLSQAAPQLARAADCASVRLTCGEEEALDENNNNNNEALDVEYVQANLETRWMGRVIVRATGEVRSTQDILRGSPFCSPLMAGTLAIARAQSGGRGRGGTSWESPSGALAFSLEIRTPVALLPFIQYGAALSVVDAVSAMAPDVCVRVKWPNDVVTTAGAKVAGVLCEGSVHGTSAVVVVGVGINVSNVSPGASVSHLCGRTVKRETVLVHFVNAFELFCDTLTSQGFNSSLEQRYLGAWIHSGQCVTLQDEQVQATIVGLAPDGCVRVLRHDGSTRDLPPDISSLDLDAGVLRAKRSARAAP